MSFWARSFAPAFASFSGPLFCPPLPCFLAHSFALLFPSLIQFWFFLFLIYEFTNPFCLLWMWKFQVFLMLTDILATQLHCVLFLLAFWSGLAMVLSKGLSTEQRKIVKFKIFVYNKNSPPSLFRKEGCYCNRCHHEHQLLQKNLFSCVCGLQNVSYWNMLLYNFRNGYPCRASTTTGWPNCPFNIG